MKIEVLAGGGSDDQVRSRRIEEDSPNESDFGRLFGEIDI